LSLRRHPERSEGSLYLPWQLYLPLQLSLACHPRRGSASVFAVVVASSLVLPSGNLFSVAFKWERRASAKPRKQRLATPKFPSKKIPGKVPGILIQLITLLERSFYKKIVLSKRIKAT
jgi:hypothetical protein